MEPVPSVTTIGGKLFFWQGYEPAVRVDLSCCAVRTRSGFVLVDPIPLAHDPLALITADGPPTAIILTNGNHQRASLDFRDQFDCPIHAHHDARDEITADQRLQDGENVAGFRVIALPGAGAGEIALLAADAALLVIGDALINLPPDGLRVLPEKYCANPLQARESMEVLRDCEFTTLGFAHGPPITNDAHAQLIALLDDLQS